MVLAGGGGVTLHDATVAQAQVRLGDVATFSGALGERAAQLPIATIPERRSRLVLSSQQIFARARGRLPLLASWFPKTVTGVITIRRARPLLQGAARSECLQAVREIDSGVIPTAEAFSQSGCDGVVTDHPMRYDPSVRAVRALRPVHAGERLPFISRALLAQVSPGQRLFVSTSVGPVVVSREVDALQPSAAGRALFVRGADGAIFSAPAPAAAP
jgi:hypothetical protein